MAGAGMANVRMREQARRRWARAGGALLLGALGGIAAPAAGTEKVFTYALAAAPVQASFERQFRASELYGADPPNGRESMLRNLVEAIEGAREGPHVKLLSIPALNTGYPGFYTEQSEFDLGP